MPVHFAAQALIKQNVTYLDITAAAVLVYDYLLTIEREARLVWPVPWNIGKVLYFLTRYPVFADTFMVLYHQFAVLTPDQCDVLFKSIGFLLGVGTLIAESILAVRTWVIWHRNRRVAICLSVALVAFWAPVFYCLKLALFSLVFTKSPHPHLPGCFLLKQNDILWVVFVLIMVFETRMPWFMVLVFLLTLLGHPVILSLTLVKGFEHFRLTHSTLISVLYRDGMTNYVYLCVLSIINVVILLTAPHGYTTLLTALQRVMHSIFTARILLHLREAAVSRNYKTGTYSESTGASFAAHVPMSGLKQQGQRKAPFSSKSNTSGSGSGGYLSTLDFDTQTAWGNSVFKAQEAQEPEIWFGQSTEGEKPETVTWFGDEQDRHHA